MLRIRLATAVGLATVVALMGGGLTGAVAARSHDDTAPAQGASKWDSIVAGEWYVPATNLESYELATASNVKVMGALQNWYVLTIHNGDFSGPTQSVAQTYIGGSWDAPYYIPPGVMSGHISEAGVISMTITPDDPSFATSQAIGHMIFVSGQWRMTMQTTLPLTSNSAPFTYFLQWANMTKLQPGETIPGSPDYTSLGGLTNMTQSKDPLDSTQATWLSYSTWSVRDTELYRGHKESFKITKYSNGYFFGESTGPNRFWVSGTVAPDNSLYLVFALPNKTVLTRAGALRGPRGGATMAFQSYTGAPQTGGATMTSRWTPITELPLASPITSGILWGIDCLSPTSCSAVGDDTTTNTPLVVEEVGGVWGTTTALDATNVSGAFMMGVSCTTARDCTAVGYSKQDPIEPVYSVKAHGRWGPLIALNASALGGGAFRGVKCTAPGNCTAVGNDGQGEPIVASARRGVWGPVTPIPSVSMRGGVLFGIDCTSSDNCTAVGTNDPDGLGQPVVVTMKNGRWGEPSKFRTPLAPGGIFRMVSCPQSGDCTAVGYEYKVNGDPGKPIYASQQRGTWGSVTEFDSNDVGDGMLTGISCSQRGYCTAVGVSNLQHPIYATQTPRGWSPVTVFPVEGQAKFNRVSCSSPDRCTAVGQDEASQPIYATKVFG